VSTGSTDHELSRADKLARIAALGLDPWGGRFDGRITIANLLELPADLPEGERPRVRIAGRIVGRRDSGKVYFLEVKDSSGTPTSREIKGEREGEIKDVPDLTSRVQVMAGQKQVGEVGWQLAQLLDLGDLIGVDGTYGKTRRGEPTVFADGLTMLAKSLEPHPDKLKGLAEEELRLRHRYLDLIYNPDTLRRAKQRVAVVRALRTYLDGQGFMEVETPTLHSIAGGAAARPFVTHHNALDIDLYLRIALELHLKRLLVGGLERVYEIGRVFRNEGISRRHNPEFTMLELYQAYGDYHSMMNLTEGMILAGIDAIDGQRQRPYGERTFDFTPPWPRARYADLFREHVGIPIDADDTLLTETARERGVEVIGKHRDVVVHALFEHAVEPAVAKSDRPVFVYDYPAALCPLTKRKASEPEVAERFELYVAGMELANAYTELNDPVTQEATFRQQLAGLPADESMAKMDEDFVRALRHGMPPAGGLGVGIDRLVMLLTDTPTIRDVILFPLLRPEAK
jgi:lysyl-tRNA synthetase class 2